MSKMKKEMDEGNETGIQPQIYISTFKPSITFICKPNKENLKES